MPEYIERDKVIELLKSTEVNGTPYMERIVKATVDLAIEAISNDIPAADVGKTIDAGWISIRDRPPEDGQLAAILTVFRGTTPGRMVARYLPKRFPNNPWTLMHGEIVYYWAPLSEVPGKEWEDVINGETIHKN